jgi:hypothetical protein
VSRADLANRAIQVGLHLPLIFEIMFLQLLRDTCVHVVRVVVNLVNAKDGYHVSGFWLLGTGGV